MIDYKTGRARSSQRRTRSSAATSVCSSRSTPSPRGDLLGRPDAEVVAEYWHLHDQHDRRKRLPVDVDPPTLARLAEVLAAIVDGIAAGLFVARTRTRRTPGGAPAAPTAIPTAPTPPTLWGQWQHKRRRSRARRLPAPGR